MAEYTQLEISLAQQAKEIESDSLLLESYANRPGANSDYVKKRTESINRRIVVHNVFEKAFQRIAPIYPLAEPVHQMMADSELGMIVIQLTINPTKQAIGFINYNPFQ